MLMADVVKDYSLTVMIQEKDKNEDDLLRRFRDLEERGYGDILDEGIQRKHVIMERYLDMRYKGQEHTVNVPLPLSLNEFSKESLDVLADSFQSIHKKRYGHSMPDPPEIVHFRIDAVGVMEKPELRKLGRGTEKVLNDALMGERDVFKGGKVRKYMILNREKLLAHNVIRGPAIIEEEQATTVLHDKQKLRVGKYGDIIIELEV